MDLPGNAAGILTRAMKPGMDRALRSLEALLEGDEVTDGLLVRAHGENLVLAREEKNADGAKIIDDRVRLTRLSKTTWGLSVRRHTGRWERTPFTGSLKEMVETIQTLMQHLIAAY